jgi:NADP-dependent 3-hydroxy acid dehydrogenase YdfG
MRALKGESVVIADAVNGIGRAIAEEGVSEGLKVALANFYKAPLTQKETELKTLAEPCLVCG